MQLGPPLHEIYHPLRANTREGWGGKRLREIERARDRESVGAGAGAGACGGGGSERKKKRDMHERRKKRDMQPSTPKSERALRGHRDELCPSESPPLYQKTTKCHTTKCHTSQGIQPNYIQHYTQQEQRLRTHSLVA
jgi:hypothetical protein